ncbi:hypothetical protein UFOVP448_38 [uncultured Caudovirales phage]|uniref:Uncharacterized protein n=1 Tax=uncultured Caudovirales phage TaxID=2100421 RepID=A0A6J5M7X1_9CAUD|nr:hypothetical protein UFOVP448_38 [uncultured Caudovirales phage]
MANKQTEPPVIKLFDEVSSFPIAKIDSICIARNQVLISGVHCEVGDNLRIITAQRKVVRLNRVFDPIRTRIRQEAVYRVRYGPASPDYHIFLTHHNIYLDYDTPYPLHYFATDIKTSKTYLMFKGYTPPKEESPSWL